jgi:hypothetical protein
MLLPWRGCSLGCLRDTICRCRALSAAPAVSALPGLDSRSLFKPSQKRGSLPASCWRLRLRKDGRRGGIGAAHESDRLIQGLGGPDSPGSGPPRPDLPGAHAHLHLTGSSCPLQASLNHLNRFEVIELRQPRGRFHPTPSSVLRSIPHAKQARKRSATASTWGSRRRLMWWPGMRWTSTPSWTRGAQPRGSSRWLVPIEAAVRSRMSFPG